jgi:hypothetical protein
LKSVIFRRWGNGVSWKRIVANHDGRNFVEDDLQKIVWTIDFKSLDEEDNSLVGWNLNTVDTTEK